MIRAAAIALAAPRLLRAVPALAQAQSDSAFGDLTADGSST